jgi:hypothetical protein
LTVTAAALGLTQNQYNNALGIIAAVHARGWPIKAAVIAVEAAIDESVMRILASANVPESQRYPHDLISWEPDGLGHDHASCGMFQQQTGTAWTPAGYGQAMNQTTMDSPNGWGTPAELMNAETSTTKFLNALARQPWQGMTNWAAAQAVQGSAFADGSNYRACDARAQQIVTALWNVSPEDDMTPDQSRQLAYLYTQLRSAIPYGSTGFGPAFTALVRMLQGDHNFEASVAAQLTAIKDQLAVKP